TSRTTTAGSRSLSAEGIGERVPTALCTGRCTGVSILSAMAVASGGPDSDQLSPAAAGRTGRTPGRALLRAPRKVPAPLGILLALVAVFGLAWALLVPLFQAPDELTHFAYAQSLAEELKQPGDPKREIF